MPGKRVFLSGAPGNVQVLVGPPDDVRMLNVEQRALAADDGFKASLVHDFKMLLNGLDIVGIGVKPAGCNQHMLLRGLVVPGNVLIPAVVPLLHCSKMQGKQPIQEVFHQGGHAKGMNWRAPDHKICVLEFFPQLIHVIMLRAPALHIVPAIKASPAESDVLVDQVDAFHLIILPDHAHALKKGIGNMDGIPRVPPWTSIDDKHFHCMPSVSPLSIP